MLELPAELQAAIHEALAGMPPERWVQAAQRLSQRYRAERRASGGALVRGDLEALAYVALLLPATYAQLHGAMAAAAARLAGWQPATLLDLGSGPGTALWAAARQWPSLTTLTAWEREPAFVELGRRLAQAGPSPAVRAARWVRADLTAGARRQESGARSQAPGARSQAPGARSQAPGARSQAQYDVVVLGHVLNELGEEERRGVVAAAWAMSGTLLLIVEPGTAAAFPIVRAAREQLLSVGAHTVAPCVHDGPCPLGDDWCHFPQRLRRPDFQRRARGAPSEWEDAKYCYTAMARRAPAGQAWGRVIREVTSNKAYAEATISTAEGVERYRALKRQPAAHRAAKDLTWGELIEERPGWSAD